MEILLPLPFDKQYIDSLRVNRSAVELRAQTLGTRRTFKNESQAAAFIRAIQCIDLTTLAGDDTPGKVHRLCMKALTPVDRATLTSFGLGNLDLHTGAVCVYHNLIPAAVDALKGKLPVAAVSTGFPAGQTPLDLKLKEIQLSIDAGATEIDVVISRGLALCSKWKDLYDEIKLFRDACGRRAHLKTIIGVGNLGSLETIAKASAVAIMAGSDFIKTSTGFEPTNATLESGLAMVREIKSILRRSNGEIRVGFKPAGGIRTAKDAMLWLILMLEELGDDWTRPQLFRLGASALLTDLERQLHHLATGRYAAGYRQAMG